MLMRDITSTRSPALRITAAASCAYASKSSPTGSRRTCTGASQSGKAPA